jgi:hypothetical protein
MRGVTILLMVEGLSSERSRVRDLREFLAGIFYRLRLWWLSKWYSVERSLGLLSFLARI